MVRDDDTERWFEDVMVWDDDTERWFEDVMVRDDDTERWYTSYEIVWNKMQNKIEWKVPGGRNRWTKSIGLNDESCAAVFNRRRKAFASWGGSFFLFFWLLRVEEEEASIALSIKEKKCYLKGIDRK